MTFSLSSLAPALVAPGGLKPLVVTSADSPVTALPNHSYLVDTTSGAVTIELPPSGDSVSVRIGHVDGDATVNGITVNRNGSDTILGDTAMTITDDYAGAILAIDSTQTDWKVAGFTVPLGGSGGGSGYNSTINALGTITTGTNTIDWSFGGTTATVNGTLTFDFSNVGSNKQETTLLLTWTSGAITWPTITWIGGVTPSLTGKTYEVQFFTYDGGTTVYAGFSQLGA